MAQQPGLGVAGVDVAFDPDDGGDVRMPVGLGQLVGWVEDGDGAAFVAVAALVVAVDGPERCCGGQTSRICWCRVGWLSLTPTISLSLTPTISAMSAAAATAKCFFDSAAHRA